MEIRPLRIGVFVDGNYFRQVAAYYRDRPRFAAPLSLAGLVAWCRGEVARRTQQEFALCRVVEMHYFHSGRASVAAEGAGAEMPETSPAREGMTLHELPQDAGGKGNEVALSVEALDLAVRLPLDVVVLVAGSAAYAALARKLAAAGMLVMVVGFDLIVRDRQGTPRRVRAASALVEDATWPVALGQRIEAASEDDAVVRCLFPGLTRKRAVEPTVSGAAEEAPPRPAAAPVPAAEQTPARGEPSGPGRSKELAQTESEGSESSAGSESSEDPGPGPRRGTVAEVRPRLGFLTEAVGGRRLFFHQSAVIDGTLSDLHPGDAVEYEKGRDPKNRPCAAAVRRLASPAAMPTSEEPAAAPCAPAAAPASESPAAPVVLPAAAVACEPAPAVPETAAEAAAPQPEGPVEPGNQGPTE